MDYIAIHRHYSAAHPKQCAICNFYFNSELVVSYPEICEIIYNISILVESREPRDFHMADIPFFGSILELGGRLNDPSTSHLERLRTVMCKTCHFIARRLLEDYDGEPLPIKEPEEE